MRTQGQSHWEKNVRKDDVSNNRQDMTTARSKLSGKDHGNLYQKALEYKRKQETKDNTNPFQQLYYQKTEAMSQRYPSATPYEIQTKVLQEMGLIHGNEKEGYKSTNRNIEVRYINDVKGDDAILDDINAMDRKLLVQIKNNAKRVAALSGSPEHYTQFSNDIAKILQYQKRNASNEKITQNMKNKVLEAYRRIENAYLLNGYDGVINNDWEALTKRPYNPINKDIS